MQKANQLRRAVAVVFDHDCHRALASCTRMLHVIDQGAHWIELLAWFQGEVPGAALARCANTVGTSVLARHSSMF